MAKNSFKPQKFYDFEIMDNSNKMVGKIRVKPSGILWSPKGSHKFLGVSLDTFTQFMKDNGKTQNK